MKPRITSEIPPPKQRNYTRRLPDGVETMQAGESILCDDGKQAACVVSYGRARSWPMARRSEGDKGKVRVWRLHVDESTL